VSKATKVEKEQRVDEVFGLLLKGAGRRVILQYAAKKGWELAPRTIDWYIAEARAELAKLARVDRESELGRAVAQLEDLYLQALTKSDLRTARLVRKDLSELLCLVGPQRIEITTRPPEPEYDWSALSDAELSEMRQLLQKAQAAGEG
jgi:hypothetical protein